MHQPPEQPPPGGQEPQPPQQPPQEPGGQQPPYPPQQPQQPYPPQQQPQQPYPQQPPQQPYPPQQQPQQPYPQQPGYGQPPAAAPPGPPRAGGGRRVVAILLGVASLLVGLIALVFMIGVINDTRCEDITIGDVFGDPDADCVNISSGGQAGYNIAGWPATVALLLVLPMSIVYAVRGRGAKLWVIPLILGLVVGGAVLGVYLVDAEKV